MRVSKRGGEALFVLSTVLAGCNVESTARRTGGVSLDGGAEGKDGSASTERTRGFAVASTDYLKSVVVSLVSPEGNVESASFIGSGSAKPGLSAALSGDTVFPTMRVQGNELVLVDRYLTSVITWVNLETSDVRGQLPVSTGFDSNPHDYVPYTATKAFVTRYEPNLDSGRRPFDAGNDLLVIDPSVPEITGSIDLTPVVDGEAAGVYPRADRALMAGGKIRITTMPAASTFTPVESRIVTVDPESERIEQVLLLDGLRGCEDIVPSPDGARLAIACSGWYLQDPADGYPDSGLVILDVADELTVSARFNAKEWGTPQITGVDWTSSSTLVVGFAGRETADLIPDALRLLDLEAGELDTRPLYESGQAFVLGDPYCDLESKVCFVSDAEPKGGRIHQLSVADGGRVSEDRTFEIDTGTGLPPRYLGRY